MKKMKTKWYIVLCMSIYITCLQAQNNLFVLEKTGTKTTHVLKGIQKITFTENSLIIKNKNASTKEFVIASIRNLNFGNYTAINELSITQYTFQVYPNPAKDQITIKFKADYTEKVRLQISDLQGRIVMEQTIESQSGINLKPVSISQLNCGLYLCRIQNGNNTSSKLFIKN